MANGPFPAAGVGGNNPVRAAAQSLRTQGGFSDPSQLPQGPGGPGQGAPGAAPAAGGQGTLGTLLADAFDQVTQMASNGQLDSAVELLRQFFEALQQLAPQQLPGAAQPQQAGPPGQAPLPPSGPAPGVPLPSGPVR